MAECAEIATLKSSISEAQRRNLHGPSAYAPVFIEGREMNLMTWNHHARNRKPKTAAVSLGGKRESRKERPRDSVPPSYLPALGTTRGQEAHWLFLNPITHVCSYLPSHVGVWTVAAKQAKWIPTKPDMRQVSKKQNKIKTSQISSGIWVCPQFSHGCSVFGQQGRCVGWELLLIVAYDHGGGFQRQSALQTLGTLGSLGGIPQLYLSLLWKANPMQALSDLEAHVRSVTFGMHV